MVLPDAVAYTLQSCSQAGDSSTPAVSEPTNFGSGSPVSSTSSGSDQNHSIEDTKNKYFPSEWGKKCTVFPPQRLPQLNPGALSMLPTQSVLDEEEPQLNGDGEMKFGCFKFYASSHNCTSYGLFGGDGALALFCSRAHRFTVV